MGGATAGLRSVDPAKIKARALELGFDLCGIAPAVAYPELGFFQQWRDRGYAGEMQYLHRSAERRADVRAILPSAQSVIALATCYNVDRPYSTDIRSPDVARIARYAWGDDYHVVIEHRLDALIGWLRDQAGESLEARRYVDTGPVQERVYAQHAGIGWIGKNTCLINPELGSWVFLAEIICNVPLPSDEPGFDQCGTCTLCIDSCPTGAIVEPRVLDSRRCLSYLTIEVKGSIPEAQREAVGSHAYGCDICQEVCPWNLTLSNRLSSDPAWSPRAGLDGASLLDLWNKKDDELRALLKGSAMKRAGVRRLRRNLAVAIGNLRDPEATAALTAHREPTCEDPLVQEHIAWAQRQLEAV